MKSQYMLFSSLPIDIDNELKQEYQRYCIDGSSLYDDGLKDVILFVKFNQEITKLNKIGITDSERLSYLRVLLEMQMDEAMRGFEKKITLNFSPEPEDVIAELKNEIQAVKDEKKFSSIRQQLFFIKLGLLSLSEEEKKRDKSEWDRVYKSILNTTLVEDEEVITERVQDFLNVHASFQNFYNPVSGSIEEEEEDDDIEIIGYDNQDVIESGFSEILNLTFTQSIIPFYNHNGNLGYNTALYAMMHFSPCAGIGANPFEAHQNLGGDGCTSLNMLVHEYSHAISLNFIEEFNLFYKNLINHIKTYGLLLEYKKDIFFIFVLLHDFEFDIKSSLNFKSNVLYTLSYTLTSTYIKEVDLVDLIKPLNELGYNISGPDVDKIKEAFLDMANGFISRHAEYFNANNRLTLS